MKSVLVLALALIVSVPAFAKITVYTADSVAVNVLQSNELARLKAPGQALEGLELTKLQVVTKLVGGVTYTTHMQFAVPPTGGSAIPKVCTLSAKSQVIQVLVNGITSNLISRPILSEASCAQ